MSILTEDHYGVIYMAKNLKNGKCYIGQSKSYKYRINRHYLDSKIQKTKFYNALNKYKEFFVFGIIEETSSQEDANIKEQFWINFYDAYNNGYNSTLGGNQKTLGLSPWNKGKKGIYSLSEETKEKISNKLKGMKKPKFTEQHKKNISSATKKAMSNEELRKKLSDIKKQQYKELPEEIKKERIKTLTLKIKGKKKPVRTKEHIENLKKSNLITFSKRKIIQDNITNNISNLELITLRKEMPFKKLIKELTKKYGTINSSIIRDRLKEMNLYGNINRRSNNQSGK